ncbi:hypothetical protein DPMN_147551 [Dreissena polymorpha]|uniref:Uncharacterized protein n=1 Tax=Dreissena polymorpha TaxID=45954 RepID=A0A9D4F978_DREPO|nr:hypothetical protein DPMN_147551 [Dreissena polymorpha]
MRENCGNSITRYNVCSLGYQAYANALSAGNLQASFRKIGIHPYNPSVVDASHFKPSEVLHASPVMPAPQRETQPTAKEFFKGKAAVPKPNDSTTITRAVCKTYMPPIWAVSCSGSHCVNTFFVTVTMTFDLVT